MAVYKIFPTKDTFISTASPTANAGKDEIVELNTYTDSSGNQQVSRILVQYSLDHIKDTFSKYIGTSNFSSSIDYYLAEAHQVPVDFKIKSYPIGTTASIDWDNGTGKFGDNPVNDTGTSWNYIKAGSSIPWTDSIENSITGSYQESTAGGGTWYNAFNSINVESTQDFELNSKLDLSIDVTDSIDLINSESIDNKGFIIKLEESLEFNNNYNIKLSYFSVDTNTIYPPTLSLKWDDSQYQTGSLEILDTDIATVDIINNKGSYIDEGRQRFKISARPTYPQRIFTTSSIYLDNYALPENSYWGIKDENTEEMIIDFDEQFTKISCNDSGPYFDVFMNSFQPERFYRILIKTELDNNTVIINNQNVFKVVRNG